MKHVLKQAILISAVLGVLALTVTGCGNSAGHSSSVSTASSVPDIPASSSAVQSAPDTASQPEVQQATLYIGRDGDFKEYPLEYEGELKPKTLIQGIFELTGWDLTLSDEVTTGKGGMTVSFASICALFSGPPEPQKEEFFVYDAETLIPTILDSVRETLQENFVDSASGGDPDSLNIYYCAEGDQPLTFENMNVTIPMDTPYMSFPNG